MVNSRDLKDLNPEVAKLARKFIAAAKAEGIDLLVTSTYRCPASQDALYAIGRTKPGRRVTNAKGWESWHQYRVAFDVVPVRAGKPIWNDRELWNKVGKLGESVGLDWGGRWKTFIDRPHFQLTPSMSMKHCRAAMKADPKAVVR